MIRCLECDTENMEGTLYCENCGSDLTESDVERGVADNMSETEEMIPLTGPNLKLIVVNTGEEIILPEKEEIIIGREDPVSAIFPDIDTTPYGGEEDGVSRKHVKITHQDDEYLVEDLNTINSSFLNKSKLDPEAPLPLTDGDELTLGRLKLNVVMS